MRLLYAPTAHALACALALKAPVMRRRWHCTAGNVN